VYGIQLGFRKDGVDPVNEYVKDIYKDLNS
jgi:hypothetical protein